MKNLYIHKTITLITHFLHKSDGASTYLANRYSTFSSLFSFFSKIFLNLYRFCLLALVVAGALGGGYYFKVVKKKEKEELENLEEEDDFFSEAEEYEESEGSETEDI